MAKNKKKSIHYVNNAEFSNAVVEYVREVNEAKEEGREIPIVPDYIASCFLKIAEGLSHKSNFIRYTHREEMVMDAVENCLKAIGNYNLEAATRTGKPNAFSYFTTISWYAFIRRIQKEQKERDIKIKFIAESGIEAFIYAGGDEQNTESVTHFVSQLKKRIDDVRTFDQKLKEYKKCVGFLEEEKPVKTKEPFSPVDSDLKDFYEGN